MRLSSCRLRTFDISPEARELGLASLIEHSCLPERGVTYTGFRPSVYPHRTEITLLSERPTRPMTLGAILDKPHEFEMGCAGPLDSAFWLPDIARSNIKDWVSAAFDYWRPHDLEVFPQTVEWQHVDTWGSPSEIDARQKLDEFDAAEERRAAEVQTARTALLAAVDSSELEGHEWRALISETGDALVMAVRGAFEMLGFSVVDADFLEQHKGKKREDLRVTDGDWTALVEVKGYTGTAKSNDLHQLTAAAATYAATEGKQADALWYMVNAFRDVDPSQRAVPFAGRDDDLEAFADNHDGCLIDSRDLFMLGQHVVLGELGAESARDMLKQAHARFATEMAPT